MSAFSLILTNNTCSWNGLDAWTTASARHEVCRLAFEPRRPACKPYSDGLRFVSFSAQAGSRRGRASYHPRKGRHLVEELRKLPFVEVLTTEGKMPEEELPAFYQRLDYVLIPATVEGGPMSLSEGLAMGKAGSHRKTSARCRSSALLSISVAIRLEAPKRSWSL